MQTVPIQFEPADPVADAQRAAAAERDTREAERTRIAAATAEAAYERAVGLGTQGQAIDQTSSEIKAEIKAAKEKAEAAEAAAAAAEQKARDAAVANQGYTPGTTDVHEIARQILMNKFSYGDDQFACFSWIISRESGWNVHAQNPLRRVRAPAVAARLQDGERRARLARQPRDPDHLGRRLHEGPVRQPLRREVALGERRQLLDGLSRKAEAFARAAPGGTAPEPAPPGRPREGAAA